jgi:hypothetical protein
MLTRHCHGHDRLVVVRGALDGRVVGLCPTDKPARFLDALADSTPVLPERHGKSVGARP